MNSSDALLRSFIDQAPVAIAMFDREVRYIAASRRWLNDFGLDDRNLRGLSHYEVFPDIPDRWRAVHRRVLDGEIVAANEDRFDRADGKVQWLRWEVRPWYDTRGVGGMVMFAEDITARKRAEERFRTIVESSPHAQVLVDDCGVIALVNTQTEQLFGYSRAELLGQPVDILVPTHLQAAHAQHRDQFLKASSLRSMGPGRDLFGLRKDGNVVAIEIGLAPIESEEGQHVLASIFDITERKKSEERILALNAELDQRVRERTAKLEVSIASLQQALEEAEILRQELRQQAIRDPLTGLFNRRLLQETLKHELLRARRTDAAVGIIMLDMDKFKYLNDTFGHGIGDAVLQEAARVISANIRADDVAFRYGGDEFIVVLPGTQLGDSTRKAELLRKQLKLLRIGIRDIDLPEIQFSIGVAGFPDHGTSEVELLKSVDGALYRAKQEGGNRVIVAS